MSEISKHARRLLLLRAVTAPRHYESGQAAYLCGLTRPEAERALRELERAGLAARAAEGSWSLAEASDSPGLTEAAAPEGLMEEGSGGVLQYCLKLRAGAVLEAVELLLAWAAVQRDARAAWALGFALEEGVRVLLRASPRGYDERERCRFIELVIRAYALADMQGLAPRRLSALLLKARGVAFLLNNASYLYILDAIRDVRKMLFENADVEPYPEKGRALPGGRTSPMPPDEVRDRSHFLADAMPYVSMYNYLQGSTRQALDHFSLTGGQGRPVLAGTGEDVVAQGAFSSAFAALAAVQSGDLTLAVSILKKCLNGSARSAGCATRSWLHAHLATVYLAAGRPDEALEHVDAALAVSVARNVQCWMAAYTALAHYHILSGRPGVAHRVLTGAVRTASLRNYLWGYNSPWFLDMLYVFRRNGLADLPGYQLERELHSCAEGRNPLLRAVANRIRGDMLLRAGAPLREAQPLLLKSRTFFKLQQLPAEKCKTCAVLAQASLAAGDQAQALRYAIEAWPCHEQFLLLGVYWPPELEKLLPAPRVAARTAGDAGKHWRQGFFLPLLSLNPENYETFAQETLKCAVEVCGASAAGLFEADEGGRPRMTHSLNLAHKRVSGVEGAFPLHLVKECLGGSPVCASSQAAGRWEAGEGERQTACVPVPDGEGGFYALYVEGESLGRGGEMDEAFLTAFGESLGVLFRRWAEAAGRAQETSRILAAQEGDRSVRTIVYRSEAMRRVLEQADTAARSNASVLIYGESGVGKELIARRIHEKSGRSGPFVAVNLSSLPEELFESEMLGYERGAFTGAFQRKIGLLEMADLGTLFIDEVPDISPRIQVKLLRLLQERNFMRLGSTRVLHSDFRLIVATNRNLFAEMRRGAFRNDLFYRICVVPLLIPPLRERPEDIDALLDHYLEEFARRSGCKAPLVDPADALKLRSYTWPGNIRELKNVLERAVLFARAGRVEFSFDNDRFGGTGPEPAENGAEAARPEGACPAGSPAELTRGLFAGLPSARELEKQYIQTVLRLTGGKVAGRNGAAELLGMSRSTLYDKLRALGVSPSGGPASRNGS